MERIEIGIDNSPLRIQFSWILINQLRSRLNHRLYFDLDFAFNQAWSSLANLERVSINYKFEKL